MEPWARVRAVRIGESECVPLLDEAIDLVAGAGLTINVEVKSDVPDRRALVRAVARTLARRRADEREALVLSTFDPIVLLALANQVRGVPLAFLFDRPLRGALAPVLRPDGVHPHFSLCTPSVVRRWKARGRFVNAWTVNDPECARTLASVGVDGIITDDVPAIRAALGR